MATSVGRVVLTFDVDDKGVVQGLGRVRGEVDKSTGAIKARTVAMGAAIGVAGGAQPRVGPRVQEGEGRDRYGSTVGMGHRGAGRAEVPMHVWRPGIVEYDKVTHGHIRDCATWQRVFVPASLFEDGVPSPGTEVEYVLAPVETDPRGPRASSIRVTAPPRAPIEQICVNCRRPMTIDAGAQAWLRFKGLHPSRRCPDCRRQRRGAA